MKNLPKLRLLIGALFATAALAACGGSPAATPTAAPVATAITEPTVVEPTLAPMYTSEPVTTSVPTVEATATSAPLPVSNDAKSAILTAIKAQLTAGPFRTSSQIVSSNGTITQSVEVVLPDRFRMTIGSGQLTQEFVILPGKSYQKQGTEWTVSPVDMSAIVKQSLSSISEQSEATLADAKFLGEESLDGVSTRVYSYSQTMDFSGTVVTSSSKLWVRVSDGLPIQLESEGEAAGIKSKTLQTIVYDPLIKIEAPIP